MNKIVNNFLLSGDKFMPELHLRQQQFTYSACGPFTKHCERFQKYREKGNLKHIYKNELNKACFSHDAAYSDSKGLAKRIVSNKILKDKAYEIATNSKYNGYQKGLGSMVYTFFDKRGGRSGGRANLNEVLAQSYTKQ